MFLYIWFYSSFFYLFLLPLSWIYGIVVTLNRISYRYGLRKVYQFSLPIIVIGNLTVGGNGKTPMVLWLVEKLKIRGYSIGVIARGYKGKSKNYPIIISNTSYSDECGDEPLLIWKRTRVLVSVSPNRVDAITALLHIQPLDIIISDDGMQHYSLFRDIEWVVINSTLRFGNGCWLPAGPMREKVSRLNTVQAIIVNGSSLKEIKSGEILMTLKPSAIINMLTGEYKPLNFFRSVIAVAGIGYPEQFFTTLRKQGIFLIKTISFPDHYKFSEIMLMSLVKENEILLMTEKDAIKCLNFAHKNWWYLRVDVKINHVDSLNLLNMVEKKIKFYQNKNLNIKIN